MEERQKRSDSSETPLGMVIRARRAVSSADVERLASELVDDSDEIAGLYREIRTLLKQPRSAAMQKEFGVLLDRLRTLQNAEARVMEENFERHRPLPKNAGLAAINRAKELLRRHESTTATDDASKEAG